MSNEQIHFELSQLNKSKMKNGKLNNVVLQRSYLNKVNFDRYKLNIEHMLIEQDVN